MKKAAGKPQGSTRRQRGAAAGARVTMPSQITDTKNRGPVSPALGQFRVPARLVAAQGRIGSRRSVALLAGVTLAGSTLIFPDIGLWPLAYVFLVPWLVCVCTARSARFLYLASWLLGLGYFLINIRWMILVTPPGYVVLSAYSALCFPLAAWAIRHVYRRYGLSVAITAPIVWVAMEYVRALKFQCFPWLFLSHTQYEWSTLIQVSDVVGAYGVSFIVVMVNGWIVDLLVQPILIRRGDEGARLPIGTIATAVVLLGALIYGSAQSSRRFFEPGPRVAVVQHDFAMYVDDDRSQRTPSDAILNAYLALARRAAAEKPDLIVLPETAMQGYANEEFIQATTTELDEMQRRRFPPKYPRGSLAYLQGQSRRMRDAFQAVADEFGIPIVLGSASMEWKPTDIPPRVDAYNSAFLLMPGEMRPVARYDKVHLVIFGEYVPFRFSHRWLYDLLNGMTPYGRDGVEYTLSAGDRFNAFQFNARSRDGRSYRAAVPICFEETVPYVAREFVRGDGRAGGPKNIDMLLTISNDGWFHHSDELMQHLSSAVFRAVEQRIPMARSVNTGTSCIIHPNGRIHSRVALSDETSRLLEPVRELLMRLDEQAVAIGGLADSEKLRAARVDLQNAIQGKFREAVTQVGLEYLFFSQRLGYLATSTTRPEPQERAEAIAAFRDQIAADLATIDRWRAKPYTAPGFTTAALQCDGRVSIYTRWGDWFARTALALYVIMLADWMWRRLRRAAESRHAMDGAGHDG
jgi:apolipoprotein N-acyltransferase